MTLVSAAVGNFGDVQGTTIIKTAAGVLWAHIEVATHIYQKLIEEGFRQ